MKPLLEIIDAKEMRMLIPFYFYNQYGEKLGERTTLELAIIAASEAKDQGESDIIDIRRFDSKPPDNEELKHLRHRLNGLYLTVDDRSKAHGVLCYNAIKHYKKGAKNAV